MGVAFCALVSVVGCFVVTVAVVVGLTAVAAGLAELFAGAVRIDWTLVAAVVRGRGCVAAGRLAPPVPDGWAVAATEG